MSGHNEKCCLLAVTGRWMQHHVSFMQTCSLAKSQIVFAPDGRWAAAADGKYDDDVL